MRERESLRKEFPSLSIDAPFLLKIVIDAF